MSRTKHSSGLYKFSTSFQLGNFEMIGPVRLVTLASDIPGTDEILQLLDES
jgi:hypothetical protein